MRTAFLRLMRILRDGDIEYTELQSGILEVALAFCFFFSHFQMDINPGFVGIALLAVGFVQLFGIIEKVYCVRRVGSMASVILWGFTAALAGDAAQEWSSVICATFVSFSVAAGWGFVRMGLRHDLRIKNLQRNALKPVK